jgi:hypothetical protein
VLAAADNVLLSFSCRFIGSTVTVDSSATLRASLLFAESKLNYNLVTIVIVASYTVRALL